MHYINSVTYKDKTGVSPYDFYRKVFFGVIYNSSRCMANLFVLCCESEYSTQIYNLCNDIVVVYMAMESRGATSKVYKGEDYCS